MVIRERERRGFQLIFYYLYFIRDRPIGNIWTIYRIWRNRADVHSILHISSKSQSMEIKCCLEFKDVAVRSENNAGGSADNAGNDTAGGFIETFWDTLPSSPIAELARSRCVPDWWIIHQDRVQSSSRGCNKSRCSATQSRKHTKRAFIPSPSRSFLISFAFLGIHRLSLVVSRVKTWIKLGRKRSHCGE